MTVYKYFLKLAYRNKNLILIYTGIYFFVTIMSSMGVDRDELEYRDIRIDIGYIDNSKTDISNGLLDSLKMKNNLSEVDYNEDEIKEELYLERYDAIILIPENFKERVLIKDENIIEVYRDPKSIYTVDLNAEINKYLNFLNAMNLNGGYNIEELGQALNEETSVSIIEKANRETRINIWFSGYFNQLSYIMILVFISIFGKLKLDFMDDGLTKRVSMSSTSNFKYNGQLYLGQLSLAGILTSIYILYPIILKYKFIGEVNIEKYIVNTVFFSFSILGLSFFINSFVKNGFMINGISTLLSLGLSFISGVFVPMNMLSERTLKIARFFPNYYYVRANEMHTNSIVDVKNELIIILLFGVVYFLLGIYFSKNKEDSRSI